MANNLRNEFQKLIIEQFLKDLRDVLHTRDCKNFFIELMQRAVEEEVYAKYTPKRYSRRRTASGLQDGRNYKYKAEIAGGHVYISMENLTTGVGGRLGLPIDDIIVTGKGYDWGEGKIPARDFYSYMEITLMEQEMNKLQNIIKAYMRKKGWK